MEVRRTVSDSNYGRFSDLEAGDTFSFPLGGMPAVVWLKVAFCGSANAVKLTTGHGINVSSDAAVTKVPGAFVEEG